VTLRARWVTVRARRETLRARWVTLRARWVTLRSRWVTLSARCVTFTEKQPQPPQSPSTALLQQRHLERERRSPRQLVSLWLDSTAAPLALPLRGGAAGAGQREPARHADRHAPPPWLVVPQPPDHLTRSDQVRGYPCRLPPHNKASLSSMGPSEPPGQTPSSQLPSPGDAALNRALFGRRSSVFASVVRVHCVRVVRALPTRRCSLRVQPLQPKTHPPGCSGERRDRTHYATTATSTSDNTIPERGEHRRTDPNTHSRTQAKHKDGPPTDPLARSPGHGRARAARGEPDVQQVGAAPLPLLRCSRCARTEAVH
jgi:hypothetical protein